MDKIIKILEEARDILKDKELEELKITLVNSYWNKCYTDMEQEFVKERNSIDAALDRMTRGE
jgi:DNA/RNA-binding domain of Phe-tRNA-synthetase-like protein